MNCRFLIRNIIVILFVLLFNFCYAQNQFIIDSLQIEVKNAKEDYEKSAILLRLSGLYFRSDFNLSIKYAEDALNILGNDKKSVHYNRALRTLGNSHLFAGNYDESLKYLFESQELAIVLEDQFELFAIYVSIAAVYDRLGNFDESLSYNFKALGVYNSSNDDKNSAKMDAGVISLYNNIGNIYLSKNQLKEAEVYYQKGLALCSENTENIIIASISNNLGKVKNRQNDIDSALYYFNKSKEIREKTNDKSGLAQSYNVLSEFYFGHKQNQLSIEYGLKSYNLGVEVGSLPTQKAAAEILSAIYDSTGAYEKAYNYYKIFKQISDSIINENTISELSRLKFMNEQVVIDNQRLKEKQRAKTRNTVIILILLAVIIIISFFLIVSRFHQKRVMLEKKEIENSVVHKKKELATNVLYLLKKNETLESVTKKLLDVKNKVTVENRNSIQKIIFELQTEIDRESWKEFEYRFQDVHLDFYKKLQESFPELTPSERKLAAFLKLNMTSKEISVVTGQSVRSLEVARYRLRKKLGITNQDTNLVNFLSEF